MEDMEAYYMSKFTNAGYGFGLELNYDYRRYINPSPIISAYLSRKAERFLKVVGSRVMVSGVAYGGTTTVLPSFERYIGKPFETGFSDDHQDQQAAKCAARVRLNRKAGLMCDPAASVLLDPQASSALAATFPWLESAGSCVREINAQLRAFATP